MSDQSGPITEKEIEEEFERATEQEQQWLTEHTYPLIGGGHAIVRRRDGFDEPLGLTYSRLNPHGVFTPDGRQIGSTCGCEDYPCCGH